MSATMLQMTTEDDIKRADKYARKVSIPDPFEFALDMFLGAVANDDQEAVKHWGKNLHVLNMENGVKNGWWEKWNDRGPIKVVRLEISEFNEKSKMAHVLSHDKVRVFKSASEAIKAGHKGPVKTGTFLFNKGMLEVIIA